MNAYRQDPGEGRFPRDEPEDNFGGGSKQPAQTVAGRAEEACEAWSAEMVRHLLQFQRSMCTAEFSLPQFNRSA